MNIWYFHHYATPKNLSGLHRPFDFGKEFIKSGNEVTVFSSSYLHYSSENLINGKEKYLIDKDGEIKVVYLKTREYSNSGVKRIINMFDFYRDLLKFHKKYTKMTNKPDIIIASSPHPLTMMAGIKIAKYYHIPCIVEVRDFWPEVFFLNGRLKEKSILGKFLLYKERKIYEKSDAIIFLKEGDFNYIIDKKWNKENGGKIELDKCHYINNGVDLDDFDKKINDFQLNDKDLDSNKFKIIYCGALRPVNNIGLLLDTAKLLNDETEFIIFGSGNCEKKIKERIRLEKITNVKLKGYVENKYIPYILSKASINMLNYSSKNYNWSRGNSSNKLFEYLASGKPIISTIKMGYDILQKYNCGLSSEDNDVKEIANLILKFKNMTQNEYLNYCQNSRNAAKDFDIKNLSKKYIDILENYKKSKK